MKEELKEKLEKIGWTMRGKYPNEWIFDHEGKKTCYMVRGDRIELSGVSPHSCVHFHYKDSKADMLEGNDAVSFGTEEQFILFMNHDLNKITTPAPSDEGTLQGNNHRSWRLT